MEENPTRICELLVGLGEVEVLGVDDVLAGAAGGAHPDAGTAGLWGLRRGSVVEEVGAGAVGGSAGVRAAGVTAIAYLGVHHFPFDPMTGGNKVEARLKACTARSERIALCCGTSPQSHRRADQFRRERPVPHCVGYGMSLKRHSPVAGSVTAANRPCDRSIRYIN